MENENSYFSCGIHYLTMFIIISVLINICYYFYRYLYLSRGYIKFGEIFNFDVRILIQKWLHIPSTLKDLSDSLLFPTEIIAILKIKFGGYVEKVPKNSLDKLARTLNDLDFCYATLNKVSRSFSVVIEQLPKQLKDSICIFYLVLRGLDSVEDDMTYPNHKKISLLRNFHKNLLIDNWSISNVGDTEDYRILLNNFDKVINIFKSLDIKYQSIIMDITRQMGYGMADYVAKTGSIETVASYNLYCHYVAGLVGHGLSSIFSESGLEDRDLSLHEELSNSMGLFLQKTNIIRDYLEDLNAGRTWWPKEIWQNYANDLSDFSKSPNEERSVECLNHMVMDSLAHLPHVIDYLSRLRNPKIFEFCAIPQVMSIATLAQLYNNPQVFTSIVKIRKGLACKLMLQCSNLYDVYYWLDLFIEKIEDNIPNNNNINTIHMHKLVHQIKKLCHQ